MSFMTSRDARSTAVRDDATRPLIVGIGGTTRESSSSERSMARCLSVARELGAETLAIGGAEMPTEMYDPRNPLRSAAAARLVEALRAADGVLIASPAYHGGISGHLKNALDYTEDMRGDTRPYLDGRAVGLVVTAMGWQAGGTTLAALRAVVHALRGWPSPLGVIFNSSTMSFETQGNCSDAATDEQLRAMTTQVVEFARMKRLAAAMQVRTRSVRVSEAAVP